MEFLIFGFLIVFSLAQCETSTSTVEIFNGEQFSTKNVVIGEKFTKQSLDVQKLILSRLSLTELFEFVQNEKYKDYHQLAAEEYGLNYGNRLLFTKNYFIPEDPGYVIREENISFRNLTKFKIFVKSFHKHIRNLKIDFSSFYGTDRLEIFNYIEKYCSKTLTRFEIVHIYKKELDFIQRMSFPNVVELSIAECHFHESELSLGSIFPNVRRLSATFSAFEDRRWVERNFLKLTHLQVHIGFGNTLFHQDEVLRILGQNRNLLSLGIIHCPPDLLRRINENFPKIDDLQIVSQSNDFANSTDIHMEYIQRFFYEGRMDRRNPINFSKLKELRWHSRSKPEDSLLGLIEDNIHTLEILHIEKTVFLNKHLQFIRNMKKLERFSLRFRNDDGEPFTTDELISFIKANHKLLEVRLIDTHKSFKQEIYTALVESKLPGWIRTFDPLLDKEDDIHIMKGFNIKPREKQHFHR